VNELIALEPVYVGGVKATVSFAFPGVTPSRIGASGGAVTVTLGDGFELPSPIALVALT
jgi:hypothetical protein